MNTYKAKQPITLKGGILRLTEKQAANRLYVTEKIEGEDDLYELTGATQFKAGEEFGYEGKVPKVSANLLEGTGEAPASVQDKERGRLVAIKTAIADLDPTDDKLWTNDEKPQVKAIEAVMDADITAEERDQAWAEYLAEEKRERLDAIKTAIAGLDPDNDDHWTADEKPQVVAIATLMGYDITAEERDQAWAEVLKEEENDNENQDD